MNLDWLSLAGLILSFPIHSQSKKSIFDSTLFSWKQQGFSLVASNQGKLGAECLKFRLSFDPAAQKFALCRKFFLPSGLNSATIKFEINLNKIWGVKLKVPFESWQVAFVSCFYANLTQWKLQFDKILDSKLETDFFYETSSSFSSIELESLYFESKPINSVKGLSQTERIGIELASQAVLNQEKNNKVEKASIDALCLSACKLRQNCEDLCFEIIQSESKNTLESFLIGFGFSARQANQLVARFHSLKKSERLRRFIVRSEPLLIEHQFARGVAQCLFIKDLRFIEEIPLFEKKDWFYKGRMRKSRPSYFSSEFEALMNKKGNENLKEAFESLLTVFRSALQKGYPHCSKGELTPLEKQSGLALFLLKYFHLLYVESEWGKALWLPPKKGQAEPYERYIRLIFFNQKFPKKAIGCFGLHHRDALTCTPPWFHWSCAASKKLKSTLLFFDFKSSPSAKHFFKPKAWNDLNEKIKDSDFFWNQFCPFLYAGCKRDELRRKQ